MSNSAHSELTSKIIQSYYKVFNTLGFGFLEKVYERALAIELRNQGMIVRCQAPIKVNYEGLEVGQYYADILINNAVIVEIKAGESLCEEHEAQLVNYLKAIDVEVGMLLNFGKKPEFKRKVFSQEYKKLNKS
jgi:GxxExxY protein